MKALAVDLGGSHAACAVVATFEQPVGHSTQGFVSRVTVEYCANCIDKRAGSAIPIKQPGAHTSN